MVANGAWTKDFDDEAIIVEQEEETEADDAIVEGEFRRAQTDLDASKQETQLVIEQFNALVRDMNAQESTISMEQSQAHDALRELTTKLESKQYELKLRQRRMSEKEMLLVKKQAKVKTAALERVHKELQAQKVVEAIEDAESVDLAFVLDCTDSMKPYIFSVKEQIKRLVQEIQNTNRNLKLRLAMVAYRDIGYAVPLEVHDFEESVFQLVKFLSKLQAGGRHTCADRPEDMAGGIKAANGLSWNSTTRAVIIIADNPCHGTIFHSFRDRFPDGTPGTDVIEELSSLSANHAKGETMNLFFGRIKKATDLMVSEFGKQVCITSFDMAAAKGIANGIKNSVRSSIFRTITATVQVEPFLVKAEHESSPPFTLWSYNVDRTMPTEEDWLRVQTSRVMMLCNVPIQSISQLEKPVQTGLFSIVGRISFKPNSRNVVERTAVLLKHAAKPFAEGGSRYAFHGRISSRSKKLENPKSAVVLKTFKSTVPERHILKHYLGQMEVSNVAHFLAKEYNKSMARPKRCAEVCVLEARVLEGRGEDGKSAWPRCCAEIPLPHGEFRHFSNNTGYWNPSHLNETLLRFSKFTHEITRGFLMVVDLQGVCSDSGFYLTDPAIHCTDILRFGSTNLGWSIMDRCLKSTEALLAEHGWD